MNSKLKTSLPYILVFVAAAVSLAWPLRFHLLYIEQLQLFQSTWRYFIEHASRPGGLSDYAGRFLTQIFYTPALGALVIAALLTLFYALAKKLTSSPLGHATALVATALIYAFLLDRDSQLSGLVAMNVGLALLVITVQIKDLRSRSIALPIATIVCYYLAGGEATIALILGFAVKSIVEHKIQHSATVSIVIAALLLIIMPHVYRQVFGVQLSLRSMFLGTEYFRYPAMPYYLPKVALLVAILTPLVELVNLSRTTQAVSLVVSVAATAGIVAPNVNMRYERIYAIDYYCYTRQWSKIVEIADEHDPDTQFAVVATNLALGKTNQLGERLFDFNQNGIDGLTPPFRIDADMPRIMSDVLYHIGLIYTAECFAFEAQEAVSDGQKSVRAIRRLAECNIINEHYAVAEKYLHMLEHTLMHAKWARQCLDAIHTGTTDKVTEWATLRSYAVDEDFYHSEGEYDQMFGLVYMANKNNKLAFDYLMAHCLLSCNVDKYALYAPIGQRHYRSIPRAYREAFILHLSQKDPQRLSGNLSMLDRNTLNQLIDFNNRMKRNPHDPALAKYHNTFWYYLVMSNNARKQAQQ